MNELGQPMTENQRWVKRHTAASYLLRIAEIQVRKAQIKDKTIGEVDALTRKMRLARQKVDTLRRRIQELDIKV